MPRVGRVLAIMGSGETTPGMLGVYRRVLSALPRVPAGLLLDSPFAFQENADELVERISSYFVQSVGTAISAARLPAGADDLALARAVSAIGAADWVFAGPGSPSYARRTWAGTPVPGALCAVVEPGRDGALVFASAAAVTLGTWALPVYEIYKVGEEPRWEPGLGLVEAILGWRCAVVPHYDNREGGTHDTRFCWVGARRLAQIEPALGDGFILGVDEHTALVVDLDTGTAEVSGRGAVTVRAAGREHVMPAGSRLAIDEVPGIVEGLRRREPSGPPRPGPGDASAGPAVGVSWAADLQDVAEQDSESLAATVMAHLPDDEPAARAALVTLVDRAGAAEQAAARQLAGQLVDALVAERARMRSAGDWAGSDRVRGQLGELGVEVRDGRGTTTWEWR